MTDAALWAEIDALLIDYGYLPEDREAMRLKFWRGREEHGEDLAALDYSGELTQETYDLAIYALLYGLLRSSPDHPSVRGLVICARLALQHAKGLHD